MYLFINGNSVPRLPTTQMLSRSLRYCHKKKWLLTCHQGLGTTVQICKAPYRGVWEELVDAPTLRGHPVPGTAKAGAERIVRTAFYLVYIPPHAVKRPLRSCGLCQPAFHH